MPASQLPSVGTAAFKNTGTQPGQIPVVQQDGLLPSSILPASSGPGIPSGGSTGDVLIKDGSNVAVWSNAVPNRFGANTFSGDFSQLFKDEAGNTAVAINQSGHTLTVNDEAGAAQITLNAVTGTVTTPVLQAVSLGTTPLPAANLTGTVIDALLSSNVVLKSANLAGLADFAAARTNLGLGTAATVNTGTTSGTIPVLGASGLLADARLSSNVLLASGNLAGLASAATARTNLGLGTVATLNTGTGNGQIPTLDGSGKFPIGVIPDISGLPSGGSAGDTLIKDGSNVAVWSNAIPSRLTANTFQGDFSQLFKDESGNTAVAINQAGHSLTVADEAGTTQITLNGVTGTVTASAIQAASMGTTPIPAANITGTINAANLPALAITDVFTVASQAAMLALSAEKGDVAVRSDVGKTFILSTNSPTTLADWKEVSAIGVVTSVNGATGAITGLAVLSGGNTWSGVQQYSNVLDFYTGSSLSMRDGSDNAVSTVAWDTLSINAGSKNSTGYVLNTFSVTYPVTVTTGSPRPISWTFTDNVGGSAGFDGFYINLAGSQAGSGTHYIARWQLGGVDRFRVDKAGSLILAGGLTAASTIVGGYTSSSSSAVAFQLSQTQSHASGQAVPHTITITDSTTGTGGVTGLQIVMQGSGTGNGAKLAFEVLNVSTSVFKITKTGACYGTFATADTNAGEKFGLGATIGGTTANLSTAIGASATADNRSTAIGSSTTANQFYSLAVGAQASATGSQATAIGGTANASGANAFALGKGAVASGVSAISIGSVTTSENNVCRIGNVDTSAPQKLVLSGRADSTQFDAVGIMPTMLVGTYAGRTLRVIHQTYDFTATREYMRTVTTGLGVVTSLNGAGGPVLIGTNTEDGSGTALQVNGNAKATAFIGQVGSGGITYSQGTAIAVDTAVVAAAVFPYNATITDVVLRANVTSTVQVEVYSNGSKISGSDPVVLTAGTTVTKSSFTGWTTDTTKAHPLGFKIIANDNATRIDVDVIYKLR